MAELVTPLAYVYRSGTPEQIYYHPSDITIVTATDVDCCDVPSGVGARHDCPPAGEALAERRGRCTHHGIHYFAPEAGRSRCAACDEVVGPDRGQDQADLIREQAERRHVHGSACAESNLNCPEVSGV